MFDLDPNQLKPSPPFVPRMDAPEPEDYQLLDPDKTAALLENDGPFAATMPRYESRPGQLKMLRAVTDAFNKRAHLMVEAGTGTGKSMAYLLPAVQWAMLNKTPVVISTNTKNLQSQLFEKDLPLIKQVLGAEFKMALIKGRSNYICIRKLITLLEHADYEIRPSERDSVDRILEWVKETETGDFSELGRSNNFPARKIATTLVSTAEECAGRGCTHYRKCFLWRARAKSLAADIIVANHSLVFAEMGSKSLSLPAYNHLILDEAHNIEDAATRHFSIEISAARLRFPLRRLGKTGKKGKGLLASVLRQITSGNITGDLTEQKRLVDMTQKIVRAAVNTEKDSEPFFEALATLLKRGSNEARRLKKEDQQLEIWLEITRAEQKMRASMAALSEAISSLTTALREIDEENLGLHNDMIRDLDAQRAMFIEISEQIAFVLEMENPDYVYWVERDGHFGDSARAWAAPVAIGELLSEELYLRKESVIFVSATLSVGGSFKFLQGRLGIDQIETSRLMTLDAGSPFNHRTQSLMLVPMFLPEPGADDGSYTEELGKFLAHLFSRTKGRGLVLFTSYAMLRQTTDIVRNTLDGTVIDVLAQGENKTRETLTEQFRDDISSVLMGTHSFWEGVDVVGESLSCVVLARLPFSVFTDPIIAARCEQIEAAGGSSFMHYAIPNAVIKFRQGFGRLIRHRTDRGIIITADRRIVSKRYGHWFRRSVPTNIIKCHDPEDMIETIEQFLVNANN